MTKRTVKNCATCWWSERDEETLTLYCKKTGNQSLKIEKPLEDAKICDSYAFQKPRVMQYSLF